jgi:hypothetical protein
MKQKSFIYRLTSLIALAIMLTFSPNLHAASATATANGLTNLTTTGAGIFRITVTSVNAAAQTVTLYDTPATNLTYTVGAYTNTSLVSATVVSTVIDILGNTNNFTNNVIYRTNAVVAASTNNYKTLTTVVIPAGTTYTYTPAIPLNALQGITASHSATGLTTVVDYSPIK